MFTTNKYVPASLSGTRVRGQRRVVKTTLTHPSEIGRYESILNHESLIIDGDTKTSASLAVRRALALLQEHQKTLKNEDALDVERMVYLRLAKTGNPAKVR
jgi:hypothetical protein